MKSKVSLCAALLVASTSSIAANVLSTHAFGADGLNSLDVSHIKDDEYRVEITESANVVKSWKIFTDDPNHFGLLTVVKRKGSYVLLNNFDRYVLDKAGDSYYLDVADDNMQTPILVTSDLIRSKNDYDFVN